MSEFACIRQIQRSLATAAAIIAFASGGATGQQGPGTSGADYVRRPVGSKSIGMGEVKSALQGDPFNWLANPATAGLMDGTGLGVLHSEWIVDTNYENISLHHRFLDELIFMGSFTYEYRPDIQGYDEFGIETKKLKNNSYQAVAGIGYSPFGNLSLGANIKYFRETLDEWSAGGVAFDLGALYRFAPSGIAIGFSAQHIGPDIAFDAIEEPLPMTIRFGLSHAFVISEETARFLYAADLVKPRFEAIHLNAGCELEILGTVAVRAGYCGEEFRQGNGLTLGGGLKMGAGLTLDYAYTPYGDLGNFHRISLYFSLR